MHRGKVVLAIDRNTTSLPALRNERASFGWLVTTEQESATCRQVQAGLSAAAYSAGVGGGAGREMDGASSRRKRRVGRHAESVVVRQNGALAPKQGESRRTGVHKSVTRPLSAECFVSVCRKPFSARSAVRQALCGFRGKVKQRTRISEIRIYTRCMVNPDSVARIVTKPVVTSSLPITPVAPDRQSISRDVGQERNIMNKSRAHLALIAMVASMGLFTACSNGDDSAPPADSGMTAPGPDAAPGAGPESAPAPGAPAQ